MNKRVIFVNPPSPFLLDDRGAPPQGLLWLAAEVRRAGHEALVWGMTGDHGLARQFGKGAGSFIQSGLPPDRGSDYLFPVSQWGSVDPKRDVIAITATSAQYETSRNLLLALKWEFGSALKVIIGGPHASADAMSLVIPHVAGEDETELDPDDIVGTSHRRGSGAG